jgi:DNA-directed RNA polymerase specialized sigma24 family protein
MLSCRDIRPELWEHARQALVRYFTHRQRPAFAEDLAQQTLMAVLTRDDFQFEREEDFLRVCYGFAGNVLQQDYRQRQRDQGELSHSDGRTGRASGGGGLEPVEARILLNEVLEIGTTQLRESDWELIQQATLMNASEMPDGDDASIANKIRVRLSRARRRLAKAAGLLTV